MAKTTSVSASPLQPDLSFSALKGQVIGVIGGTGFIGRAVVKKLADAGAQVLVLCRNADRAKRLKVLGDVGQVSVLAGDALNDAALARLIAASDKIVNLVGILHPSGKQNFENTQAELPARIAKMAKGQDLQKIVHVSAIGADANSASAYARTKAAGEAALAKDGAKSCVQAPTILRPSIVFGPGDGFFNRFGQMAMIAPALPLIGGGKNKMQPVYVGDVAQAICIALAESATDGQIYELGGPHVYSFKELMALTLQAVDRRRALVPVPFAMMALPAAVAGILPNPPVTSDQLKLLKLDNVVSAKAKGIADLGITPQPVEAHIFDYLAPFKPGGRFAPKSGR